MEKSLFRLVTLIDARSLSALFLLLPFVLLHHTAHSASQSKTNSEIVRVYKSLGSKQCQRNRNRDLLEEEKRQLTKLGIFVYPEYYIGRDIESVQASVCGGDNGLLGVFAIKSYSLSVAQKAGFKAANDKIVKTQIQ